jgi:hypothetical protein
MGAKNAWGLELSVAFFIISIAVSFKTVNRLKTVRSNEMGPPLPLRYYTGGQAMEEKQSEPVNGEWHGA